MSLWGPDRIGSGVPLFNHEYSTPLHDGAPEGVIPKLLLWAMKNHRRAGFGHRGGPLVPESLGEGPAAVYVIDGGSKHATLGRLVGSSPDGSTYCLVTHIDPTTYDSIANNEHPGWWAVARAQELILCAVYDGGEGVSNVTDVQRYPCDTDVPTEYLPPNGFIEFPAPL